ncbi:hypothetical protein F0267_01600 [Vibrio coralliilyticus]|uniref:Uncharacterized protein n=1 Tax=Vibrio coralliilyticus TaxID=190893 RepID=A0AAN0SGT8_9VIBR|nr:hypothetical protein [Vibrio coralliilyticus]AIW22364.1 hypothetical protein IX92_25165 [Vibrio coralliilyticus]NOH36918.1 hypothetical protein [Vibrio coralliilyticus]
MPLSIDQSDITYIFLVLVVVFIIYTLSGASDWVGEHVRAKKLANDEKELELEERRKNLSNC